jgi:putative endonuclease
MDKITTGIKGERHAVDYLRRFGYKILEVNWKARTGEIDIIASDNGTLVFVEVKHRATLRYGNPSEAVNTHKQYKLSQTAALYIKLKRAFDLPARFDVIEVLDNAFINHIRDAFESKIRM